MCASNLYLNLILCFFLIIHFPVVHFFKYIFTLFIIHHLIQQNVQLCIMCVLFSAAHDGRPIVARPNPAIPDHLILQLDELINSGLSLEDAVTFIRGKLVPAGYTHSEQIQKNLSLTS